MTLEPNSLISHYKILSPIGKGGMGEVYRARDERLDRQVAIKMLPEDLAGDKDRLARFEQEAKATSALNHPNILTVYDIGEHEGSPFLVAELLEGEELRERLQDGPIPEKKTIEYARQIASGLSAAHGKGIVHRDLKPENIFITSDERVKILDFGIAKLTEKEPVQSEDATRKALTDPGMVLGTAAYMSPEQVRGEQVDHRSDIFSFGSIFHEMLAGKRIFQRETMAETMAAILKEEPEDLFQAKPNLNAGISGIVERCLEKKPEQRFQSTEDLRFALENISATSGSTQQAARETSGSPATQRRILPVIGAAALILLGGMLIAGAAWYFLGDRNTYPERMIVSVLPPTESEPVQIGSLASLVEISPDGRAVMMRPRGEGIHVRYFDSLEFVTVPGSETASNQPAWGGSSSIIYESANAWYEVTLPDGIPQELTRFEGFTRGVTRSSSGDLLFSANFKLMTTVSGGESVAVKNPVEKAGAFLFPAFLPGTNDFLVLFQPEEKNSRGEIWLATLENGSMTNVSVLLENDTPARFTPHNGGQVLFVSDNNLYAQELDHQRRSLEGEPKLLVRDVASQPAKLIARAEFSVSHNGVVAWRSGQAASSTVTAFDRTGNVIDTAGPAGSYTSGITISPVDASTLLVGSGDRSYSIVYAGQESLQNLPFGTEWFAWLNDGTEVAGRRESQIVARNVESGAERTVGTIPGSMGRIKDISPDGRNLMGYCSSSGPLRGPVCLSSLSRDGVYDNPVPVFESEEFHPNAVFSPYDGYILYRVQSVDSSGIYVQQFPGAGRRTLISKDGWSPVWRGDGKEILYYFDEAVWSVTVSGSPGDLSFGEPVKLFSGMRAASSGINLTRMIEASSDGSRIYHIQEAEQPDDGAINLMFGF